MNLLLLLLALEFLAVESLERLHLTNRNATTAIAWASLVHATNVDHTPPTTTTTAHLRLVRHSLRLGDRVGLFLHLLELSQLAPFLMKTTQTNNGSDTLHARDVYSR